MLQFYCARSWKSVGFESKMEIFARWKYLHDFLTYIFEKYTYKHYALRKALHLKHIKKHKCLSVSQHMYLSEHLTGLFWHP